MLLIVLLLGIPQDKPAAKPSTAELKFAWPERIEATVETERSKEQREGTTVKKKSFVRTRHRMQVQPHTRGRLIRSTGHELLEPAVATVPGQDIGQVLSSLSPSIVVDNEGTFDSVEDVETLKKVLESLVAPTRQRVAGTEFEKMINALTSEEFLASNAMQDWDALVGNWVGAVLSEEIVRFEGETPIPIFPDMQVVLKGTMQMISKGNCRRAGKDLACATFELRSSIDPKSFEALLERIIKTAKGPQGIKYERFDVQTLVRVTLEADTMLPHNFTMAKTVQMVATVPGEGRMEAFSTDARTAKYSYITPSAPR